MVPHELSIKSLKDIIVLHGHLQPKLSVIAEHFDFHKHGQSPRESITEFNTALLRLATHCQFGTSLTDALRDQFVCGLQHDTIQQHLLSETDLTYDKAMGIAKGMEAADTN